MQRGKNYKNRLRVAKVIVKNKMSRSFMVHCVVACHCALALYLLFCCYLVYVILHSWLNKLID